MNIVLRAHPAVISGVFAAYIFGTVIGANEFRVAPPNWYWITFEVLLNVCTLLIFPVWSYEAARFASARARMRVPILVIGSAAALSVCAIAAAFLVIPFHLNNDPELRRNPAVVATMLLFGLLHLVLAWSTATFLVNAEANRGQHQSTFVTFLLFVYLMIGVWLLRPRVLALAIEPL